MKNRNRLTRRDFLKATAGGMALSMTGGLLPLASGCGEAESGDPNATAPPVEMPDNIIVLTADDLGWHDLSCYGNRDIETPNIDRLANEGVKFDNAFVTASSCSPSRACLITGQYPHTNGVDGLTTTYPGKSLAKGYRTLPGMLRRAGYNTYIEGKWHVAPFFNPYHYGYNQGLGCLLASEIQTADRTLEFLEANKDNRFYMEINYMNNHRDSFSGEFDFDPDFPISPNEVSIPAYYHLPDWPEIRLELAKYYSQTLKMDFLIGQLLDKLDELGLTEKTMVLFVSDNGPPWPGNKMTLYDRGVGEPLLVRWPQWTGGGSTCAHPVSTVDIMPTILEGLGLPIPEPLQGVSFLSLLQNTKAPPTRDAVFAEMTWHVDYLPTRMIRCGQWKFIKNYSDLPVGLDQCADMEWAQRLAELPDQPWTQPRVPEELYDLNVDANEQRNLVDDPAYRQVYLQMRQRLRDHMAQTEDPYLDAPFTRDYEES